MDLPASQTHGFLFADLREYARFVERRGDLAAAALLDEYRRLVREVIGRFRGAEIRTEGDSFYVVFPSASIAVQCGLAILGAVNTRNVHAADPIHVGIGVHAGETAATAEGLVGSAVNIAARVCGQARAGELLVTDTVRSLTRTFLPVRFEARGTPRLKGIEEPIALYRVVAVEPGAAAVSLSRRGRSPRPWVLAGTAAAAALLVAATVLAFGAFRPTGAAATPSALASPSIAASLAVATLAPSATIAVAVASATTPPTLEPSSSSAAAEAYPNVLEADLLARMPDTVLRGTCGRAGLADREAKATASIHCDLAGATDQAASVTYDRFASGDQMQIAVVGTQDQYRLAKGNCRQQAAAWQQWSFGGFQGKLLCFTDADGHATVVWSYDSSDILARASRSDAMAGPLYAWWTETSALMVR